MGGNIRSSQTLLVHKTNDLISFAVIDPTRPGTWYVQMLVSRDLFRARPTPSGAYSLELLATPHAETKTEVGEAAQDVLVANELAFPYPRIHIGDHITAGRLLIFTEGTFTRGLVLADHDRDGYFETAIVANTAEWLALDLNNPANFR